MRAAQEISTNLLTNSVPNAFTEKGLDMLVTILRSKQAVELLLPS